MEVVESVADEEEVAKVREEVVREAAKRRSGDIEGTALRILERQRKEAILLKQDKAELLANVERLERENAELKGRLYTSTDTAVQNLIDQQLVSTRLLRHETDKAIAIINQIRCIHSLGVDPRRQPGCEVQIVEAKRTLNRALRCLLFESHSQPIQVPMEVVKFVDQSEFDGDFNLQVSESLLGI